MDNNDTMGMMYRRRVAEGDPNRNSNADAGTPVGVSSGAGAIERTPDVEISPGLSRLARSSAIYTQGGNNCSPRGNIPCSPDEIQQFLCASDDVIRRYYASGSIFMLNGSPDYRQDAVNVGLLRQLVGELITKDVAPEPKLKLSFVGGDHTGLFTASQAKWACLGVKLLFHTSVWKEEDVFPSVTIGVGAQSFTAYNVAAPGFQPVRRSGPFGMHRRTGAIYFPFFSDVLGGAPRPVLGKPPVDASNEVVPVSIIVSGMSSDWTVEAYWLQAQSLELLQFVHAVENPNKEFI